MKASEDFQCCPRNVFNPLLFCTKGDKRSHCLWLLLTGNSEDGGPGGMRSRCHSFSEIQLCQVMFPTVH